MKGNIVDNAVIDVIIDQEKNIYNRVRSKLLNEYRIGDDENQFDLKVAVVYWKVHDRIAEETNES